MHPVLFLHPLPLSPAAAAACCAALLLLQREDVAACVNILSFVVERTASFRRSDTIQFSGVHVRTRVGSAYIYT